MVVVHVFNPVLSPIRRLTQWPSNYFQSFPLSSIQSVLLTQTNISLPTAFSMFFAFYLFLVIHLLWSPTPFSVHYPHPFSKHAHTIVPHLPTYPPYLVNPTYPSVPLYSSCPSTWLHTSLSSYFSQFVPKSPFHFLSSTTFRFHTTLLVSHNFDIFSFSQADFCLTFK